MGGGKSLSLEKLVYEEQRSLVFCAYMACSYLLSLLIRFLLFFLCAESENKYCREIVPVFLTTIVALVLQPLI